ncbi:hypothetical protein SSX86_002453 [Deinandra increscens subsp. villosa]|uniref:Ubiquitin-like protease family profile domain-containing protein n=1 Tax=Deinandra increscens subsp. villosa TaxID=3103831 RepID=A0AAP0DP66_9ASTR
MKTVIQISASDSKREVSGDADGDPSVANLRTKRKHDVFKHLLTGCRKNVFGVRKSPRISKNQAIIKFSNTLDNPICLDSPDMSDRLASTEKKVEKSSFKRSKETHKTVLSDISGSKAKKGETSSQHKNEMKDENDIDEGITDLRGNRKADNRDLGTSKSKHGNTPCKRKVLTGQSKVKKSLKIYQPVVSEDPDDDFMDSRTVKRAPLPPKHKLYDGQKISPRNTPRHLCGVIQVLTDEQKEVVKAMGFGAFLEMKLTQIPTALAYWLVNNYDVGTGSLVTEKGVVKIDAKLINSVLGVPLGTETITIIEKTTDRDPVAKEWRSQFEEGKTKITLHDTLMMMNDRKDAGRLFQLNFLVVLCTSVIRVMQSGTVNQCFLNAITPGTDVKNMKWCEYIVKCLNKTKNGWIPERSYAGPITLLATIYARVMLKDEYVKSGYENAIGWVDDTTLENLDTVLATDLFKRNLELGVPVDIQREVKKRKKICKVKASRKKTNKVNNTGAGGDTDVKLVNADGVADLENVNINSNVAENGKGTEVGTVVHEDSVGHGNHASLKGIEENGNELGTVVHEDSVGQFKPDSLKGKKEKAMLGETDMFIKDAGLADVFDAVDDDALTIVKRIGPENADVVERTLVDDDDRDHEDRVNECNSVAIEADMGKVDAGTIGSVEALHVEEDKTHSGADYVNEEEHVSVLIDDFKMDTQDVDYYRAQFESEHEMNVDGDGNVRIPMMSQYGPTQDYIIEEYDELAETYKEEDRLLYIKKCISDFQDCYIQVINTLRIAEREYPHSDAIRQKKWEWGQMVRKLSSEMEKNGNSIVSGSMINRGVEAMHKSGVLKSTEMGSKVRDERFESNSGSGSYFADGDLGEAELEDGKTPCDKGKSKVKMSTIEDSYDTFKTPEQIVKPLDCHIPTDEEVNLMGRPKRRTTLPDALRSPFANRRVLLIIRRSGLENNVGNYVFSSCGSKWDIVYSTQRGGDVIRAHMESLCPGVKVHANVIGAWSKVLNNDRIYRQRGSPVRLFCSPNMLMKESYKKSVTDAERIKEFTANMETVLYVDELLTVNGLDMVFIPIAFDDHNYVLCFNLKKARIDLLDHSGDGEGYWKKYKGWPEMMRHAFAGYLKKTNHPRANEMNRWPINRMLMSWRTKNNHIDCGVFIMRHMETFEGTELREWKFVLSNEGPDQTRELEDLRIKYVTKILLHEINTYKKHVTTGLQEYLNINADKRKLMREGAIARIGNRLNKVDGK